MQRALTVALMGYSAKNKPLTPKIQIVASTVGKAWNVFANGWITNVGYSVVSNTES